MLSKLIRKRNEGGFTLIELMIVVAIIGILAAIAIPAFMKYMKQAKTSEATKNLEKMGAGAVQYYLAEHVDAAFAVVDKQFPNPVGWTPGATCCGGAEGDKCQVIATDWDDGTAATGSWVAMKFGINQPFYYQYQSEGGGAGATFMEMEAQGDLDCNGTTSLFEQRAEVDLASREPKLMGAIKKTRELE